MFTIRNIFLLIELLLGFSLLLYFWLIGMIFSPMILIKMLQGDLAAVASLLVIILGTIGLWGMGQLAVKVMLPSKSVSSPQRLRRYIGCGFIATAAAIVIFGFPLSGLTIIFILPAIVAAHFVWLAKNYML